MTLVDRHARLRRLTEITTQQSKAIADLTRERDRLAAALEVETARANSATESLRQALDRADRRCQHAGELALQRETIAALDKRCDELRRAVAWWEQRYGPAERARQMEAR